MSANINRLESDIGRMVSEIGDFRHRAELHLAETVAAKKSGYRWDTEAHRKGIAGLLADMRELRDGLRTIEEQIRSGITNPKHTQRPPAHLDR